MNAQPTAARPTPGAPTLPPALAARFEALTDEQQGKALELLRQIADRLVGAEMLGRLADAARNGKEAAQ